MKSDKNWEGLHNQQWEEFKKITLRIVDLGREALMARNYNLAYRIFSDYWESEEYLKQTAKVALNEGNSVAFFIYEKLKDRKGMRQSFLKIQDRALMSFFLSGQYEELFNSLIKRFRRFTKRYIKKQCSCIAPDETINVVFNLLSNYEAVIGIAKGGLWSSFVFNLYGKQTILCESHKLKGQQDFRWLDNPQQLEGKKVLVCDKDVITGRCLERVIQETQQYNPASIDLFLNYNPPHSRIGNIPEGYQNIYYPNKFGIENFIKAIDKLEEILGSK